MPKRKQHKIESNCVTFEDDCYNETSSFYKNITEMEKAEVNAVKFVYKTGETFVKEITAKIKQAIGA